MSAEQYVREVLAIWGQEATDEVVKAVAAKVARAVRGRTR